MAALAGIRVIELAHIMSGPTAGMLLADLGADVIKVEKVPGGDDTRRFTPPEVNGEASAFMMMNRNKRGIALDLKQSAARDALHRLIDGADVVIENFRVGTLDKLGLGYEDLRRTNPGLIYCAISGYGRTGPDADKGGFDLVAQGLSGLMRITGEPGGPPTKVGSPVTDINAGILAALGIVAAYVHRLRTGQGQLVDTSLLEAGVMQTFWQSAIFLGSGKEIGPLGSAHPLTAPYQAFATQDGWITIGASNQSNFEAREICRGAPFLHEPLPPARLSHLSPFFFVLFFFRALEGGPSLGLGGGGAFGVFPGGGFFTFERGGAPPRAPPRRGFCNKGARGGGGGAAFRFFFLFLTPRPFLCGPLFFWGTPGGFWGRGTDYRGD